MQYAIAPSIRMEAALARHWGSVKPRTTAGSTCRRGRREGEKRGEKRGREGEKERGEGDREEGGRGGGG